MNTLVGDNSETESRWAPAAGLVGTPSTPAGSLKENREISKVGNGRIRWVMVELAWGWLHYQARSSLT